MDDMQIVQTDFTSLEKEVGDLLVQAKATIALAESCTGGLVASMLTDIAGSSDYFIFSAVTYSNETKVRVLGVEQSTLDAHGAVSEETARQMAQGVRQLTGATYGLSTSGVAGPGGGSEEKPVGTVCIGIAGSDFSLGKRHMFSPGDRLYNKRIFARAALEELKSRLILEDQVFLG